MVLSIGMIVKNEVQNLRRCLTALQPILTQVDSELIIADTGSTDETVSIAREFTNQVFEIKWNDNFAEARNHTLRRAKGEWFMFLDADEFFVETADLIQFFNSGEYKHYGHATHLKREYSDKNHYALFVPMRLYKRYKGIKFEGIIHETIAPLPPRKDLQSYSDHIGYMYEGDEEKRRRKFERNIALLLKLYNRNPLDARTVAHIVNEYVSIEDPEEEKKYIELGLDIVRGNPKHPYFHSFYQRIIRFYALQAAKDEREKIYEYADAYLEKCVHLSVTAMDIYYYMAFVHQKALRYREAASAFEKCWALIKQYHAGKLDTSETIYGMIMCMNDEFVVRVPLEIMTCYSIINDYDPVFLWSNQIDIQHSALFKIYFGTIDLSGQYDRVAELYKRIAALRSQDQDAYENLRNQFEAYVTQHPHAASMIAALSTLEPYDDYIRFLQLRQADLTGAPDLLEKLDYFWQPDSIIKAPSRLDWYGEIFYIAFKEQTRFLEGIERLDINEAASLIVPMVKEHEKFPLEAARFAEHLSESDQKALSPKALYWLFILYEQAVLTENETVSDAVKDKLFVVYIETLYAYMRYMFAPAVLTDEGVFLLTDTFRFGYFMHKAAECREQNDDVGYVRNMKTALNYDDRFVKLVQLRINQYRVKAQPKTNLNTSSSPGSSTNSRTQLQLLIENLKASVNQLIAAHQYDKAEKVLMEYEKINPTDRDIKELKETLLSAKGD